MNRNNFKCVICVILLTGLSNILFGEPTQAKVNSVKEEAQAVDAKDKSAASKWDNDTAELKDVLSKYEKLSTELHQALVEKMASLAEQSPEAYAQARANFIEKNFEKQVELAMYAQRIGRLRSSLEQQLLEYNGLRYVSNTTSETSVTREEQKYIEDSLRSQIIDAEIDAILKKNESKK